jgi:hypothetical protein
MPPRVIAEAHATPLLRAAMEREQTRLDETMKGNDELMREVTEQRARIKELLAKLQEPRDTFAAAVEEIARVSRGVEGMV